MGRAASLRTLCFEESTMAKRSAPPQRTDPVPNAAASNTLKRQFMANMELAGMGLAAQKRYLFAVERLMRHYWCSPGGTLLRPCAAPSANKEKRYGPPLQRHYYSG
jgi:hypothetical protein